MTGLNFDPYDEKWFSGLLNQLTYFDKEYAIDECNKRYQAAFDSEPYEVKKENRGQFDANTWLRKFVEKKQKQYKALANNTNHV